MPKGSTGAGTIRQRTCRPLFVLSALLTFGCSAPDSDDDAAGSAESAAGERRYRVVVKDLETTVGAVESTPDLYVMGTIGPLQFRTPVAQANCYGAFGREHCYVKDRYAHWYEPIGVLAEKDLATVRIAVRVYDEDPLKWDDLVGTCEKSVGESLRDQIVRGFEPSAELSSLARECSGTVNRLLVRFDLER
jgi:hypothetical protein